MLRRAVDKRMDEWRGEGDLAPYQGAALADVATPRAALLPTMSGACVPTNFAGLAHSRHVGAISAAWLRAAGCLYISGSPIIVVPSWCVAGS